MQVKLVVVVISLTSMFNIKDACKRELLFLYGYGAPLGGSSGRWSSAISLTSTLFSLNTSLVSLRLLSYLVFTLFLRLEILDRI